MQKIVIACIALIILSKATCDSNEDYYGEDSGDYDSATYKDTLYDSFNWPLNLEGAVRHRMALNGAIADPWNRFICSPISALLPLGKLVMGATGNCQKQLLSAIGESSIENVKSAFKSLLRDVRSLNSVTLSVCSRIYVSKDLKLNSEFEKHSKEIFKSSVKRIDLNEPARVAGNINNWVNTKTNGMIPEIIQAHDITPDSSVILVNAIYFSGQWKHPFKPAEIRDFYTATTVTKVLMMQKDAEYKYLKSDDLDCQIVEIPYDGGHASFVIFLPNSKDGLPILLYKLKLAPALMQIAMTQMKMQPVILSIPKFKSTRELDLNDSYKKLGLTQMFQTQKSGLNGIVEGQKDMYVSKAKQKVVIEVNEQGTQAAAVSVMEVELLSMVLNQVVFNANKPFYYFIKVKKEMIFTGTYTTD